MGLEKYKITDGNHLPSIDDGRHRVYSKQFNELVDYIDTIDGGGVPGTGLYDVINEYSTNTGCTVEGVLLKDGHVYLSNDSLNEGRIYFDTDNDTYLTASNDNNLSYYSNNNYIFLANPGGITMQSGTNIDLNNDALATGQLIFDADGDSYMSASADDVVDFYAGGFKIVEFNSTKVVLEEGINLSIGATTGSTIGGALAKIGFWGVTPVVQPTGLTANDAQAIDATYGVPEQEVLGNVRTRLLELENRLKDTGLLGA